MLFVKIIVLLLQETSGGNVSDVQVWLLDLQPTDGGVCLLLGATNSHVSPQFFYALGSLYSDLYLLNRVRHSELPYIVLEYRATVI